MCDIEEAPHAYIQPPNVVKLDIHSIRVEETTLNCLAVQEVECLIQIPFTVLSLLFDNDHYR